MNTLQTYVNELMLSVISDADAAYWATVVVMLLVPALLAALVGALCRRLLLPVVHLWVKRTSNKWDDYFLNPPVLRAACMVVPGVLFAMFLPYLHVLRNGEDLPSFYHLIAVLTNVYITGTVIHLINTFLSNIIVYTTETSHRDNHHVVGIVQFLKILVYGLGAIVIVALLFGKNPVNLIAGLGAAATVLMLVFKDSILGLVAGIQLSANKMLKPGDWVTLKNHGIDGVVEHVSLTTVKIRNFDNTISTVPPYTLVSDSFQNWDGMVQSGARRVKRSLFIDVHSITFATAEQMAELKQKGLMVPERNAEASEKVVNLTLFREYAEHYLSQRPYISRAHFLLARHLEPTPTGVPVELWFFFTDTRFVVFEHMAAEAMEHLLAVLPAFGLRHYQQPGGSDLLRMSQNMQKAPEAAH